MTKLFSYAWDANIFIAWLGAEEKHLAGISAVLSDIEEGKVALVVPSIIYSEVLAFHRTAKDQNIFKQFMKRSNIIVLDVTVAMANRASEIRSRGKAAKPRREIGTCDALYMAAALTAESYALHTTET